MALLAGIATLWIATLLLYWLEERREGRPRRLSVRPAVDPRDDRLV